MKSILILVVLLWFGVPLSAAQAEPPKRSYTIDDLIQTVRISERVLLVRTGIDSFDAVTAVATPKGIVMIDAGFTAQMTERYKKIIAKELGRDDFRYVINTHSHWDHTYGNQVFADATFIGHEKCRSEMIEVAQDTEGSLASVTRYMNRKAELCKTLNPASDAGKQAYMGLATGSMVLEDLRSKNFKLILPTVSFSDRLTLSLGDVSFELIYFGPAHTESDILVYIPEEKLLFTGDLFFSGGGFGAGPDTIIRQNVTRWHDVLADLLAPGKEIVTIIHGHGMILTRQDVATAYERDIVRYWQGFNEGKEPFKTEHIAQILQKSGVVAAVEEFRRVRTAEKERWFFIEGGFRTIGNALLSQDKTKDAVEFFKMNMDLFPQSWDALNRLGDAYMKDGNRVLAKESYKKALALNPDNASAKEMLRKLNEADKP